MNRFHGQRNVCASDNARQRARCCAGSNGVDAAIFRAQRQTRVSRWNAYRRLSGRLSLLPASFAGAWLRLWLLSSADISVFCTLDPRIAPSAGALHLKTALNAAANCVPPLPRQRLAVTTYPPLFSALHGYVRACWSYLFGLFVSYIALLIFVHLTCCHISVACVRICSGRQQNSVGNAITVSLKNGAHGTRLTAYRCRRRVFL